MQNTISEHQNSPDEHNPEKIHYFICDHSGAVTYNQGTRDFFFYPEFREIDLASFEYSHHFDLDRRFVEEGRVVSR